MFNKKEGKTEKNTKTTRKTVVVCVSVTYCFVLSNHHADFEVHQRKHPPTPVLYIP